MGIAMKKTIIIFLLLSIYSLAQENRLIRQNDLTDSLNAIRTLIGTGGSLPDSVLFSSDSTAQRTFSDAKYLGKSDVAVIFPDANTIQIKDGEVILLDPATLEINGSNQLTVIGGTGGSGGWFGLDGNGDLMPSLTATSDDYYELDGNGDIMPQL